MKFFLAICLVVGAASAVPSQQQPQIGEALSFHLSSDDTDAIELDAFSNYCVAEHNAARAQNGRGPLNANARLAAAAERHNAVMVQQDCFSHQCPGEPGLGDRVSQQGYAWWGVGENIAKGYGDCQAALNGWMNSAGHRNNILGDYQDIGCHRNANGNYYTCVFGKPR